MLCIMSLAEMMKNSRKELRITQLDLAEMSEVGLATVKDIERGKGNPSLSTIENCQKNSSAVI